MRPKNKNKSRFQNKNNYLTLQLSTVTDFWIFVLAYILSMHHVSS